MPVPKKKSSRSRKGMRNAHSALAIPQTAVCPECGAAVKAHRVCPECGQFKGEQVVQVEES
ncbi:MAG: 50S ribosomal protein L32 [Nitrospinota bacterium]|nr:50S ribosomal protein L32 [Nitrospinota bacterium]MDH5678596.1 50S ribosomal protein L32 [Nitrospinota bacterium]MDH5757304.1 50S ribosomal protein L32 [Nitrospinota bacterium]